MKIQFLKAVVAVLCLGVVVFAQTKPGGGGLKVTGAFAVNDCAKITGSNSITSAGAACGTASGDAVTTGSLAQFAATTSLELKTLLSDETGSGASVFATSPTLVSPILGTPTSVTLTNGTGLPESGVTSLTTDLAAKAPLVSPAFTTPNLGTPSAATLTNATGLPESGVTSLTTDLAAKAPLVSPSFTTPTLGVATATSINKMAVTAPATSSTLAVADGKTATINNTLTFAGTDSSTITFPGATAGVLRETSGNTISAAELSGVVVSSGSNVTTPGKADVMQSSFFCADAGSNDTYACNLSPAVTAYVSGAHYWFKGATANTGAASINFNSVGAATIKKAAGGITTDLADNDIRANQYVDLVYDGTNMEMQSLLGNAPSGSGTVTSVATTSPITGGTITGTGTIACASCVTSSSPGVGLAHFAGSTQAVTSAAVTLSGADVTGTLPVANGGTGQTTSNLVTSIPSSDTISAAGAFATTLSIPGTNLAVGSVIEVFASGIYTTGVTSSPLINIRVDAGGTNGQCTYVNSSPTTSQTAQFWNLECRLQIDTTGNPGTAMGWGQQIIASNGGSFSGKMAGKSGTNNYITTSSQTLTLTESATMVSGQTLTLQSLYARIIP